jgi:uncharacterized protein (TIGR03000 family)
MFVTPALGEAQHGGGHGGSGHCGGGHGGGGHVGGGHSGAVQFNGGHFGGAHSGGYYGRYYHGGHHYYPGYGYGLYGFYPYYDYGPYYNDYGTGSYYGSAYDSGYTGLPATTDSYPYAPPVSPAYPYDYSLASSAATSSTAPLQDKTARVTVTVASDAQVWLNESGTKSIGLVRQYQSPPLTPGSRYTYEIRARWNDNGHETTQTQKVAVTAGSHASVNFPIPAKPAGSGVGH